MIDHCGTLTPTPIPKRTRSVLLANGQDLREYYTGFSSDYTGALTDHDRSGAGITDNSNSGSDRRRVRSDHTRSGGRSRRKELSKEHGSVGSDTNRVVNKRTRSERGSKERAAIGREKRKVVGDHNRKKAVKEHSGVGNEHRKISGDHERQKFLSNPKPSSARTKESRRRHSWNDVYDSKGRPASYSLRSLLSSHDRTTKSLRRKRSHSNSSSSGSSSTCSPTTSIADRFNYNNGNVVNRVITPPFNSPNPTPNNTPNNLKKKHPVSYSQNGTRRRSLTKKNVIANHNDSPPIKFGSFRPYFVPIKKKRDLLGPTSHHSGTGSPPMIEVNDGEKSPGPTLIIQEGMQNIAAAPFLHEGILVLKVSHKKPGKCQRRFLTLSEDHTTLFLTHSKLPKGTKHLAPKQPTWASLKGWKGTHIRSIDVANICHFQVGAITTRPLELAFARYSKASKEARNHSDSGFFEIEDDCGIPAVTIFHIDSTTGRMVSLDFFIENNEHRQGLLSALNSMKYTYTEASQLVGNEILLLRSILKDMELSSNGKAITMNEKEFSTLCRRLNFRAGNISNEFREFCKNQTDHYDESFRGKNRNKLTFHECLQLLQLLKGKENPSLEAWRACFGNATCVKAIAVLENFLHGPQQEQKSCDLQDARDLVNIMNATELGDLVSNRKGSLLTQWQFEEFLRSEWNDIYDPAKRVIDRHRLLTEPLSHYWINSSFNTSVMTDGTHSVECYVRALLRGCKSIDLECWDGNILPDGEHVPIICPRKECLGTVCKMKHKLTFQSVVLVVRKYLDDNRNSYPIILNLENNCSKPFQKKMTSIMKEVLGGHLFVPNTVDRRKELPSPEDLRGMIVINARRMATKKMVNVEVDSSNRSKIASEDAYAQFNPPTSGSSKLVTFVSSSDRSIEMESELSELTLFHDADFTGYFLESMNLICSQMHDINDTKVLKIANNYADNSELWRKFNETHLTRIYPTQNDLDSSQSPSSNTQYSPVLAWAMGCQMKALNFQSQNTDLAVNDGLFRQTGGIGYLPKPLWLLGLGERPPPTKLKIRVISGNCIPKLLVGDHVSQNDDSSVDNPSVVVELHDVVVHPDKGEFVNISHHKVPCKNGNGFCPVFEDSGANFVVETPDVASLVFRVEEETKRGTLFTQTAVPVNCLRRGYRSVQLYDMDNTRRGRFASATLLVFLE
eukprot:CAMPEP_0172413430 /NCGR_PEP_ID=MMETSP1061-20121228/78416_1 /TAXON_ID=37318 /ORGANISM="Pseudo-nitzschia pungens, Strain cf. pungens" /LENGTH=1184 /DNA_ID=CAMNT_0013149697 /DNA_START=178 /DNA_END=3732 /DNA_ORIENTATION=+